MAALYTGGTDVGYVRQVLKGVEKEFTRVVNELLPGASTTTTARGDANETTTQTTLWHAFQTGDTSSRFTQRFLHLVESCDARWERGIHTRKFPARLIAQTVAVYSKTQQLGISL